MTLEPELRSRLLDVPEWNPRRVAAVECALPEGVTPPGTRGRILQASLALFAETGFHGTSIRAIAQRVGINSATLYAHYPSKEQVLADLVLIGHAELAARMTRAVAELPPESHDIAARGPGPCARAPAHRLFAAGGGHQQRTARPRSRAGAAPLALRADCAGWSSRPWSAASRTACSPSPTCCSTATAIGALRMQVAHWFGPDQPASGERVAEVYASLALRMAGLSNGG